MGGGAWMACRPGQGASQQASRAEAGLSSLSPKDASEEHPWMPNLRASWGTFTTPPGQRPTGGAGSPEVDVPHPPTLRPLGREFPQQRQLSWPQLGPGCGAEGDPRLYMQARC